MPFFNRKINFQLIICELLDFFILILQDSPPNTSPMTSPLVSKRLPETPETSPSSSPMVAEKKGNRILAPTKFPLTPPKKPKISKEQVYILVNYGCNKLLKNRKLWLLSLPMFNTQKTVNHPSHHYKPSLLGYLAVKHWSRCR